ncbi:hypothetical protein B0H19DRAFT_1077140 [Mycena capillaripes]|nr:hypothetical protein B0H19DRAFT_1077140 [Mycena capillaripes]
MSDERKGAFSHVLLLCCVNFKDLINKSKSPTIALVPLLPPATKLINQSNDQGTPPTGIHSVLDSVFCHLLELIHFGYHCPQPPHNPPPFTKTYGNLNCASEHDSYQTYGFVEVVAGHVRLSLRMHLLQQKQLNFKIAYHDVYGQGSVAQLTCTLYKVPLTVGSASYCGGEHQPDGSTHHIINSDGYCKKTPTA